MKKVGIVTLNGYFNYGNRLQNYALQEVLKTFNMDVETLIVERKKTNQSKVFAKVKKAIKYGILIFKGEDVLSYKKTSKIRTQRFIDFTQRYIHETDYYISEQNLPYEKMDDFDFFVSGSDQVWNPEFNNLSSVYFLEFAPKNKRISYAASFGISELPENYIELYKSWLSNIPHLSVREKAGSEIVKSLTGRDAEVVLDPTLMLTKSQWLTVAEVPVSKPKNKFLLTYFLGDVSSQTMYKIKQIAKERNLEVVNLANIKDKKAFIAGPSEFLNYINSAEVFFTDSFHGAVFSILFEKPFVILQRQGSNASMHSRIDTLLSIFDLNDRKWENITTLNEIYDVDYSHVPFILEKEREKSTLFLKKAFA